MSKESFDSKKAVFDAIPESEIKYPDVPVDEALQEAEELYVWCLHDKELLVKASLDWKLVKDLPIRTDACRYAESKWLEESNEKKEAQLAWKEKLPEAKDLRDELLHHFKFAYEKYPSLKATVKKISEGDSQADMIQDLSDLAVLGKANPEPLKAISIDLALLDKAEVLSKESASLRAMAHGSKSEKNQSRIIRDKAYLHLQEAVEEIYRVGQYVFWKDDDRLKGYYSKYKRKKSKKKKKDGDDNPDQTTNNTEK